MAEPRSLIRIALNVALDGIAAGAAVPVSRWVADPAGDWLHPLWTIPAGAAALLLAGLAFRLPWQYWRFAGLGDLLGVAGSSVFGAALFALFMHVAGVPLSNPALPVIHTLTLLAFLGAPRVIYRRSQVHMSGRPGQSEDDVPSVLLVGAGEDVDLFLRALAQDKRQSLRVMGLLVSGSRQTGRRIHGIPILGAADNAAAVLDRLKAEGRLPGMVVVASPGLSGPSLAHLLDDADRHGIMVRRAPRPTALHPATRRGDGAAMRAPQLELKPVAIEDLLNRPQVPLDREGMA